MDTLHHRRRHLSGYNSRRGGDLVLLEAQKMKLLTWLVLLSIIIPCSVIVVMISGDITTMMILLSGVTIDAALLIWLGVYGERSVPAARLITDRVCLCWILLTLALAVTFLARGLHIL
jgi:hypothetical protein